jgi:uncharacterized membrane protein HdeD (DUF308 family)
MSATREDFAELELPNLAGLRRRWVYFVALGAALVLVGAVALGSQFFASQVTVVVIGCLLVVAGIVDIIGACQNIQWDGSFVRLMAGVLPVMGGVLFIREPADDAMTLAMLLACVLLVEGILRTTVSGTYQPPGWRSEVVSATTDLMLGFIIWATFHLEGFWLIGLLVPISLVLRGFNWIGLGMTLRTTGNGSMH